MIDGLESSLIQSNHPTVDRRSSMADVVVVVGLLAVAVHEAHSVTAGLNLPPDPDLFRSAAISQTIADGAWTADPFFAGEANWYNPLLPAVIAILHRLTGTPILELYARGGVLLNLLGPLAFWAMVRVLFGSGIAVAAVFAFLFLPPRLLPGWSTAGYWPWLFSGVFTQGLFYLGLLAADSAGRLGHVSRWLLAGVALGVVFLGHTAPALILGGVLVLAAVHMWRRGMPAVPALLRLAGGLSMAGLVSLPLVLTIAVRYRFHVVNDVLALWAFPETEPGNLVGFLGDHANAGGALALVGAGLIGFDRERRQRAWVVGHWALVTGAFLFIHFARPWLDSVGLRVPQIVTAFHFVLYGEAIVTLLAGYALWRSVELLARAVPRQPVWMPSLTSRAVLFTVIALSVWPALPHRRAREDFDESRERALRYENQNADQETREWIRSRTKPGTVFLAFDRIALYVVAPAGGKVVAVEPLFANTYVDVATRDRARAEMVDRIVENDRSGYCAVAGRYRVEYVVLESERPGDPPLKRQTFLQQVHAAGGIHIFRAPQCGSDGRQSGGAPPDANSPQSPGERTVRNDPIADTISEEPSSKSRNCTNISTSAQMALAVTGRLERRPRP